MYCQKCGKEVQGNFCMNCGNKVNNTQQVIAKTPIYKKWWFWVLAIIIIAIIGNNLGSNTSTSGKTPTDIRLANATKILDESQKALDNQDLETAYKKCNDVINNYSDTQKIEDAKTLFATIKETIPTVTATDIAKEYNDNEVKADINYKDKFIRVTGTVDSIGKFVNDTYIYLKDGNTYSISKPHFYFSDENEILKVAELKENDKVNVLGTCKGATISSATFYNCIIED